MSRNDYTKYARESKMETPEIPETPVEIVEPVVVETPVEPEVMEAPVIEAPVEPVPVEVTIVEPIVEDTRVMGRVFGCSRLNVRKAPKPRAEVVCEINSGVEVVIDEENSTFDFYKICTVSGVEGYCVKTYITKISNK